MVVWLVEKSGLLFSILNRSDFGEEEEAYVLVKGQIRKIAINETCTFTQLKNYSVRILFVGSLVQCQEQFLEFCNSARFAMKFSNRLVSHIIKIFFLNFFQKILNIQTYLSLSYEM